MNKVWIVTAAFERESWISCVFDSEILATVFADRMNIEEGYILYSVEEFNVETKE